MVHAQRRLEAMVSIRGCLMDERNTMGNSNQRNLVIGLAIIVVLLVGIAAIMIYQTSTAKPVAQAPVTTAPTSGMTVDANGNPTGGTAGTGQGSDFDEATAQKIPADTTPQKWVEAYYKACDKADWKAAWERLPAAKRETTSADALAAQLEGYGITGWKISGTTENDQGLQVQADQETTYGTFTSIWTFVKASDGKTWLLQSKAVAGMQ